MDPNKPEPTPQGMGREITPLVIKDLQIRSKMGVEKYGEALKAFNGRNPMIDLYQELLDAAQYARQVIEEQTYIEYTPRASFSTYMSTDLPPPLESIAQEAHRLVLGDRGDAYGHPIFDMTRTADMLTSLLRNKLKPGERLEAEDIAQAMVCVKQSRQRNKAKRDNQVDTAGYALTLEMIREWRDTHPGVDPRDVFPSSG